MSDKLRESVSALMDGEVSELELRRVLTHADSAEVRERWRGYQLARGAISGDSLRFANVDLSSQVAAAVEAEAVPAGQRLSPWWKSLGGLAVAASVAAVVVVGGQGLQVNEQPAAVETVDSGTGAGRVYPASGQAVSGSRSGQVAVSAEFPASGVQRAAANVDADREAERRLHKYLLQHTERAALNNGQGMINFARVPEIEGE